MGIINVTPDSFSDGGLYTHVDQTSQRVSELLTEGAGIIDIGAESTAPGNKALSSDVELDRLHPHLKSLAKDTILSIDTFRSSTAESALRLGATMINDVSALRFDSEMASVIAAHRAYVCMMYSKEAGDSPHATKVAKNYDDCVGTIIEFLSERIDFCLRSGIGEDKIIIDPGMGAFVSTLPKYSWQIIAELPRIKEAFPGIPLLVGASRKGFLGGKLKDRDPISQFVAVTAAKQGADIIRTHNVQMAAQFFEVSKNISL